MVPLVPAIAVPVACIVVPWLWRMIKRRPDVKGKTVFITGGSEGIGKALGQEFVRRGANVVLMARTESKLQAAVKDLEAAKVCSEQQVGFQTMDVTDFTSVQAGVKKAVERYGSPSFLITSAGASYPGYFLEQDVATFQRTMNLNYMGNVHAIKAVAPLMKDNGGGNIMIVASAAAVVSFVGYSSYSPSKYALRGLADSLRNELSGFGIRVSICYPPDTDTPGFKEENKTKPEETLACFPGSAYPPEQVAAQSVHSLLVGDYHIQSVDILQNLLVSSMSGVTPRSFPVLETLLQPLIALVEQPFWMWFDFQARRYARKDQQKASTTSPKKDE
eukprot:TRINITY_DN63838_c0_g1_i1.p1 TRINITY_DN63838_c0_g1~~TRINITY_DN63838_c0_g1_i1.p1  ORF type:complete len:332 (-),score=48.81 TRINITY_DN63838_c0_g1_i1:231-1226(-)